MLQGMSTKRTALFALACLAISLLVAGPAFGQFSCPYPGPGNIAFCEKYVPAKVGTAIQPVYGAGIDPDVRPFQPVLRSEDRRCRGTICDWPNVPEAKPGEPPATIKKEVVYSPIIGGLEPGRGGNVQENWDYWKAVSADGTQVEIRGGCYSACTLVMSHVPWERICFGEHRVMWDT